MHFIQQRIQQFMLDNYNNKKQHRLNVEIMRKSIIEGGPNIESLFNIMNFLHAKMTWKYIEGGTLLSDVMK